MPPQEKQLAVLPFEDAVEVAFDTSEMLIRFKEHFSPYMPVEGFDECRLSRVRVRDGQRGVFQYEIAIANTKASQGRIVSATGTIYANKDASHIVRKLSKQDSVDAKCSAVASSMTQLNMLVQLFPQDRRLPHLSTVLNKFPTPLVKIVSSYFGVPGHNVEQCKVSVVRYRAGLSAVLRISPPSSAWNDRSSRNLFAKIYPASEEAKRSFDQLKRLSTLCANAGVTCVSPIGFVEPYATVLLEGAVGLTLEDMLTSNYSPSVMRNVAETLAKLNTSSVRLDRHHTSQQQSQCLIRAVRRLCAACPKLTSTVKGIACKISNYPEVVLAPTHRDIKPEHLFFDKRGVTFIDCDSMAMADPVIDPAMLLARMTALSAQGVLASSVREDAAKEFVTEYFQHVPAEWMLRMNHHFAGALLEIAVGFFGRQEAGWRSVIHRLVDEARLAIQRPRFDGVIGE